MINKLSQCFVILAFLLPNIANAEDVPVTTTDQPASINQTTSSETLPPEVKNPVDPEVQKLIDSIDYGAWDNFSSAIANCNQGNFKLFSIGAVDQLSKFNMPNTDPTKFKDQLQQLFDSLFTNFQIIGWQDSQCVVNVSQQRQITIGTNTKIPSPIVFNCSFTDEQVQIISTQASLDNAKKLYQQNKALPEVAFLPITDDIFSDACTMPNAPITNGYQGWGY